MRDSWFAVRDGASFGEAASRRFAFAAVLLCAAPLAALEIHVAPTGSPSFADALATARTAKEPVKIVLADGTYFFDAAPVVPALKQPLVVEPGPGAHPVFSAGRRICDWRVDTNGWWHAAAPKDAVYAQFYVDGVRRFRPFLPRTGYHFAEKIASAEERKTNEAFVVRAGDFPAGDNPDLEVCMFYVWNMARAKVAAYDASSRLLTMALEPAAQDFNQPSSERWYRFDNVKSALGEPGDWYHDRAAGEIVYVPCDGETPSTCETIVAVREQALVVENAADVLFCGVRFEHASWCTYDFADNKVGQAASFKPAAVDVRASRRVRFEHCAVAHVGAYALAFENGSTDCAAVACEFYDLGAGGVKIGNGHEWKRSTPMTERCRVEDCLVESIGRVEPSGVGVLILHARGNVVSHNTIHDTYYSGISLGWNWSFVETARDNVIEWNHIYDIGQNVLSDMGGIYLLGKQPGSVERFNYVHDVTRSRNCAFGIYFDSGSSDVVVSNNVVRDCEDYNWFVAQISSSNRVENNVFADAGGFQIYPSTRDKSSHPSRFARNLVLWQDGRFMPTDPGAATVDLASNVREPPSAAVVAKAKALATTTADPVRGFTDADLPAARNALAALATSATGNLSVTATNSFGTDAAAGKIGFVPFALTGCGRRLPRRFTQGLSRAPDGFTPPPDAPLVAVAENFDALADGAPMPDWNNSTEGKIENLHVVSGGMTAGGKCLQFNDVLSDWRPHVWKSVLRSTGVQKASFAVKQEKGTSMHFEVRDPDWGVGAPGPEVRIAGGWITARGKRLVQAPADVWIRFELVFELGAARKENVFSVHVTLPGDAAPRVFDGIPLHAEFRRVGWLGFMSYAHTGAKWWLDDVLLTP